MIHENNTPYRKPKLATGSQLWDFVRIGYVGFYCLLMLRSIWRSWVLGGDIATKVVPWRGFLIHDILMSVAVLFASQLQIEKRKLNTSISQHLGLRWQGIDLKMIGLFSLIYVMIYVMIYVGGVKEELNKKSAKIGAAAVSAANTPALDKPWWAIWVIGLAICLLGPITEEMLFRGVIMHEFRARGLSKIYAWLATSILFMIPHGKLGWVGSVTILRMGLLFGWLRMRTGTLFVSIWAHILKNTLVFMSTLYLLYHGVDLPDMQFVKTIKYYYTPS